MGILKIVPTKEMHVREWFAAHLGEFEYSIIKSGGAFPDYVLEDADGKQHRVEVESKSANFIQHGHNPSGCDWVLCWIHNAELSVPVLELSTRRWFEAGETGEAIVERRHGDLLSRQADRDAQIRVLCKSELANEYAEFVQAYAVDLRAQSDFIKALEPSRLALFRVEAVLCSAIRDAGVTLERMAVEDLFKLVVG